MISDHKHVVEKFREPKLRFSDVQPTMIDSSAVTFHRVVSTILDLNFLEENLLLLLDSDYEVNPVCVKESREGVNPVLEESDFGNRLPYYLKVTSVSYAQRLLLSTPESPQSLVKCPERNVILSRYFPASLIIKPPTLKGIINIPFNLVKEPERRPCSPIHHGVDIGISEGKDSCSHPNSHTIETGQDFQLHFFVSVAE